MTSAYHNDNNKKANAQEALMTNTKNKNTQNVDYNTKILYKLIFYLKVFIKFKSVFIYSFIGQ
jgi:hypothetical protein